MSDINWRDGAVCCAYGKQWFIGCDHYIETKGGMAGDIEYAFRANDFQLNEITTGDYIPASELDTEKKYNDVVEVFGLFGFPRYGDLTFKENVSSILVADEDGGFSGQHFEDKYCKRKLTYHQIIAIGKLKRMMLDREKSGAISGADLTADKHKSAVDYLTDCVEVQKQRGEQYDSTGTGERSFNAAAKAYNALTGGNLKGSDVCLILTCVKAVRQYSNPDRLHEDSLLDLVSYASLWAEELNKELK